MATTTPLPRLDVAPQYRDKLERQRLRALVQAAIDKKVEPTHAEATPVLSALMEARRLLPDVATMILNENWKEAILQLREETIERYQNALSEMAELTERLRGLSGQIIVPTSSTGPCFGVLTPEHIQRKLIDRQPDMEKFLREVEYAPPTNFDPLRLSVTLIAPPAIVRVMTFVFQLIPDTYYEDYPPEVDRLLPDAVPLGERGLVGTRGLPALYDACLKNRADPREALHDFLRKAYALGYGKAPLAQEALARLTDGQKQVLGSMQEDLIRTLAASFPDGVLPLDMVESMAEGKLELVRTAIVDALSSIPCDPELVEVAEKTEDSPQTYVVSYAGVEIARLSLGAGDGINTRVLEDIRCCCEPTTLGAIPENQPADIDSWIASRRRQCVDASRRVRWKELLVLLSAVVRWRAVHSPESLPTVMYYVAAHGEDLFHNGERAVAREYLLEFYRLCYAMGLRSHIYATDQFEYSVIRNLLLSFSQYVKATVRATSGHTEEERFQAQVVLPFLQMVSEDEAAALNAIATLATINAELPLRLVEAVSRTPRPSFGQRLVEHLLDLSTRGASAPPRSAYDRLLARAIVRTYGVRSLRYAVERLICDLMPLFREVSSGVHSSFERYLGLREQLEKPQFRAEVEKLLGRPVDHDARQEASQKVEKIRTLLYQHLDAVSKALYGQAQILGSFSNKSVTSGVQSLVELAVKNHGSGSAFDVLFLVDDARGCTVEQRKLEFGSISGNSVERRAIALTPTAATSCELWGRISYRDRARERAKEVPVRQVFVTENPSHFPAFRNPYFAGSAVTNPALFFGRTQDIQTILRAAWGSENTGPVIVHGRRKIGKSSILIQIRDGHLERHLSTDEFTRFKAEYQPVYTDFEGIRKEAHSHDIYYVLANDLAYQIPELDAPKPSIQWLSHDRPEYLFDDFIKGVTIWATGRRKRILLMLDEFDVLIDRLQDQDWFFGHLRSLFTRIQGSLIPILSGQDRLIQMLESHAQRLFAMTNQQIEISALDEASALSLVTRPLAEACGQITWDADVEKEIVRMTACHPYYIQAICHALTERMVKHRSRLITHTDLLETVRAIVERNLIADFLELWGQTRDNIERLVLTAAAHASGMKDKSVSVEDIQQELGTAVRVPSPEQVADTLGRLQRRYILRRKPDADLYEFRVPLVGYWIQRNHTIGELAL